MIVKVEDLLKSVTEYASNHTDDETITLLENITDTVNDLNTKYSTIDEDWRKRYIARFNGETSDSETEKEPETEKEDKKEDKEEKKDEEITIDDLFEKRSDK